MSFSEMQDKILLGDCYELIKEIPDNSIDLIVIDPPYEFSAGGGGGCFGSKKRKYHEEYYKVSQNTYRQNTCKIKQRKEIKHLSSGFNYKLFEELDRVMIKTNIYIWCSKKQIRKILEHYEDKKCNVDILTWHKDNIIPTANNTYLNDTEYCVFAREKGVKVYGTYDTKKKYYVTHSNINDKKLYNHPTIKPINIIKNLIINSSKEGDIVLDCFCGSGTTCVACKKLNRRFIGMEIDSNYHKIACDRLNGITANGQTSIFTNFEEVC